jgi:hypothetical protein
MNFFSCWLWILGMSNYEYCQDFIQDSAKDRHIHVNSNKVIIDFSSEEEAKKFAEKLGEFAN